MDAAMSYEVQVVARAVDIPARRLEGWVERGVVVPTVRASGTGTRTRFSQQDVLRVAMLAEIQRLFGTDFRPGGIAAAIGHDPLTLPWLDTVLGHATPEDSPGPRGADARADVTARLRLYVHHDAKGRRSIGATRKPPDELLRTAPVLLVIDPTQLWRKIEPRLKD